MNKRPFIYLTLLTAVAGVGCKKKSKSAPPSTFQTANPIGNLPNCGMKLSDAPGVANLPSISAKELEVSMPSVTPMYANETSINFLVSFDPVEKDDPVSDPEYGHLVVETVDGEVLYDKTSATFSEALSLPKKYHGKVLNFKASGCLPAYRRLDDACGAEQTFRYVPKISGSDQSITVAQQIYVNQMQQENTCVALAAPAAELLNTVGFLQNGREVANFDMSSYSKQQQATISAAAMIYSNPPGFGAACATGLLHQLVEETQDLVAANTRPSANLAETSTQVADCGSEELRKICLEKGAEFEWDGTVCTQKVVETIQVVRAPVEADCLSKGEGFKWQSGMCVKIAEASQADCTGTNKAWDATMKVCVQTETKTVLKSSFSFPVSIITENQFNKCVTLDGAVNAAACDAANLKQVYKVEGVDNQYISFKTTTADTPQCLTMDSSSTGMRSEPATNGTCTAETQKFVLNSLEYDGNLYYQIRSLESASKPIGRCMWQNDAGAIEMTDCTNSIQWETKRKQVWTLKANGGGKPLRISNAVGNYIMLRSELSRMSEGQAKDRCLRFGSGSLTLTDENDCQPKRDDDLFALTPDINNYYTIASKVAENGKNYCVGYSDNQSDLAVNACHGLGKNQKFEIKPFQKAGSDTPMIQFVAKDSNKCLGINGDSVSVVDCSFDDYELRRSQLFSIMGNSSTGVNTDENYVVYKSHLNGGLLIGGGALLMILSGTMAGASISEKSLFRFEFRSKKMKSFYPGISSEIKKLQKAYPGRIVLTTDPDSRKVTSFAIDGTPHVLIDTDGKGQKVVINIGGKDLEIDGEKHVKETNSRLASKKNKYKNGMNHGARIAGMVVGGFGVMLGAGLVVWGSLETTDRIEFSLADTNCTAQTDPFAKFTCLASKAQTTLERLDTQETVLYDKLSKI